MSHHPTENISFVCDKNGNIKSLNYQTQEVTDLCTYENVIAMEYVQINDCLCFATKGGEIVQYNLMSNELEVVGVVSDGIETMSFSPDQELVVFISR
jgi:WD40 repeat protein